MTLVRLALAALFGCALLSYPPDSSARADGGGKGGPGETGGRGGHGGGRGDRGHGGHGHGGGKGDKADPAPAADPAPQSNADGTDTRGDSSRRQFCMRWPSDYWCKEGDPVILAPKKP